MIMYYNFFTTLASPKVGGSSEELKILVTFQSQSIIYSRWRRTIDRSAEAGHL